MKCTHTCLQCLLEVALADNNKLKAVLEGVTRVIGHAPHQRKKPGPPKGYKPKPKVEEQTKRKYNAKALANLRRALRKRSKVKRTCACGRVINGPAFFIHQKHCPEAKKAA